ncbi:MAG: PAS domain S-box protein [Bacteroidetes bacterium]|nr:PAS domain S-box protein [Bacteroidota bacterium]
MNIGKPHIDSTIKANKAEILFRMVPSAIFTVDMDRKITDWNKMAEEITGYYKEEVVGKECNLFAGEPCSEHCGLFDSLIPKPQTYAKCTIKTKEGKTKYINKNVEYLYDGNQNVVGGIESFQDITDFIETQKELKKSEEKFKATWEGSIDGMRITDKAGNILMVNEAYCNILGFTEEELIGKPFVIAYNERQESILTKYIESFSKKMMSPRFDTQLKLWDNRKKWFAVAQSFVTYEGEEAVLSVLRDITEAKKSEIISGVIYDINNAVYEIHDFELLLKKICDILNRIVKSDNFFIALYNKGDETISIPYLVDEFDDYDSIPARGSVTGYVIRSGESLLMDEALSDKLTAEGEIEMVGTASKIWLGVPIRVRDEIKGVVVMQDYEDENAIGEEERELIEFTSDQIGIAMDRILSRRELEQSEGKLRESNDAKDKFFRILSHDLKNPFVTIKGFLEILQQDYDDLTDEERKMFIKDTFNSAEKTYDLLITLLTWSRSQSGKLEINKEDLNLKKIVDSSLGQLLESAKAKFINLESDIPEEVIVNVDKFMFETVLRNLVSNAIKFTRESGKIIVLGEVHDEYASICVKDNGVGIDSETIDKLFRLDVTTTTKGTKNEEGTGLGLILCKDFVEKNGGQIRVESVLNEGTSFIFTCPLKE